MNILYKTIRSTKQTRKSSEIMANRRSQTFVQGFVLAPEQIQEFRQTFMLFDKNNDGKITNKELGVVIRSLGQNPTEAELQRMINEGDINGDGTIDFQEFLMLIGTRFKQENREEDLKAAYQVFDKDKKGYIDAEELRFVLGALKHSQRLSQVEIDELLADLDVDKNGKITYERYTSMIAKKE